MNIRDTLERLFWTVVAAFLGGLAVGTAGFNLEVLEVAAIAAGTAAVNFVLLVARARLAVLPNPGDGLPGLEVDELGAVGVGEVILLLCIVILVLVVLIADQLAVF